MAYYFNSKNMDIVEKIITIKHQNLNSSNNIIYFRNRIYFTNTDFDTVQT